MKVNRSSVCLAVGLCTLIGAAGTWKAPSAQSQPPAAGVNSAELLGRVRAYHNELHDMASVMKVTKENNKVLSGISEDFAQFVHYGFREFKYSYKNPDKVKIESNALLFHAMRGIMARNGSTKFVHIPALFINRTASVAGQANKKETALDFGVMAGDLWDDYNIWYERTDHIGGKDLYVIALHPKNEPRGGNMVVWLDPKTLAVAERDRYNMDGKLTQKHFFYNWVHPTAHLYIPTVIRLYNAEDQFGGELDYSKITVNHGIPDGAFH